MPGITYGGGDPIGFGWTDGEWMGTVNVDLMPEDGWVDQWTYFIHMDLAGDSNDFRHYLAVGTDQQYLGSLGSIGHNGGAFLQKTAVPPDYIRAAQGQNLRWGFLSKEYASNAGHLNIQIDQSVSGHEYEQNFQPTAGDFGTWIPNSADTDRAVKGTLTYIVNAKPTTGTWQSGTISGDTADLDPVFNGDLPHPEAVDNDAEYSTTVQVKITRVTDGLVVWNNSFTTTQTEKDNREFSRRLGLGETLLPGHDYIAEYRHMDSWGIWSNYSATRSFSILVGPQNPTITSPVPDSKIDYTGEGQTGAPTNFYAGEYEHPEAVAMDQVQVQIRNESGTVVLNDSGWIAPTVGTGSPGFEVAQWHGDLAWATGYQVWMRTSDINGLIGTWGIADFRTDSPPNIPTDLEPQGGVSTGNSVLSCRVVDPDATEFGDTIAWVEFDVLEDGVALAGYPLQVTGPFPSNSAVECDILGDATPGTTIEWRARASDGVQTGEWSGYVSYQYADAPTVNLLAPSRITNLVPQPSAEYDPTTLSAFWTEASNDATNFVQRVNDAGAYHGEYVWEMTSDGLVAHDYVSGDIPVDTAKPVIAGVAVRKITGTGSHTFDVQFLDSGGSPLGVVDPDTTYGDATDVDPGSGWTVIGGFIPASSIPVGTTDARIRFRRTLATALTSTVQFDAFRFYQPNAAITSSNAKWFGFINGDREGRTDFAGRYEWSGTPGDSTSSGPAVMMDPGIPMLISYTSGSGKIEDRITLERWTGTKWVRIYNGGWVDSDSNEIFLPNTKYQNQSHYRVMVDAKSGTLLVGSSPWMEFQTDYQGPAQLPIHSVDEDSDNARITATFAQSALPTEDLLEIQLAVQPAGGDIVVVERITDPNATSAVFHTPLPRVNYKILVRQVEDTEYGPVESRWSVQEGMVDYTDWHFKGVEDPLNDHVRFTLYAELEPVDEPQTEVTGMRGWGEAKPTHYLNSADYYVGSTPVYIMAKDEDRQTKNDALNRLIGKIACLLQTLPDEKRFVTVTSAPRKLARRPYWVTYDVAWEENGWVEDAVLREG